MSRTLPDADPELGQLATDLDEVEQAWFDDEFAAIIGLSWADEPPTPSRPGRLPGPWHEPAAEEAAGPRHLPRPRRMVSAWRSRQRSPPV